MLDILFANFKLPEEENLIKLSMDNLFSANFKGEVTIKEKIDKIAFKKLLQDIELTEEEEKEYTKNK